MFEHLKKHSVIVVTGPQRSGTKITAMCVAHDTGHRFRGEASFEIHDEKLFRRLLNKKNVVIQAPAMSHLVDELPDHVCVVFSFRPIKDIIASQDRVKWERARGELIKYGIKEKVNVPVAVVKYIVWERQKAKITHWAESNYEELQSHELWRPPGPEREDTYKKEGPG